MAARRIQTLARGWMARRLRYKLSVQRSAAVAIQRMTRGHLGRRYVQLWWWDLLAARARVRAAAHMNRVWRGHRVRRIRRQKRARDALGPSPSFGDWAALAETYRLVRTVGVWQERRHPSQYNVFLYRHKYQGKCQWNKPDPVSVCVCVFAWVCMYACVWAHVWVRCVLQGHVLTVCLFN
jgi:hypothetical protein